MTFEITYQLTEEDATETSEAILASDVYDACLILGRRLAGYSKAVIVKIVECPQPEVIYQRDKS